ncbi:DUF3710 domain-containing protein [Micrococcus lylae]|uniref:DUF3710 domain-containing protein n=1 Tax=Micrococcus lylae TaxID=1273 RepID=A0ABY2K025_9MICC|nr:DUF3710 domain-containing protein [Micrococcus lylae]MCT2007425.1 DUF3710 domain-containing protein [Micrococcus lylae]MCT2070794.1 DUF3710 domain-containing protein [Micrococcus lylae]TFH99735.1 DUF3710 domain-containing protein [Micrococcus lylae]
MIFGRNRNVRHEQVTLPEELMEDRDRIAAGLMPAGDDTTGPFDVADRPDAKGYIDLGSLRIKARQGMKLRLDLEDKTQRVIAVTVTAGTSAVQLQAFAAPRRTGLWDDLRAEILDALGTTPGAVADERQGRFGTEVMSRVPASMPDGSPGWNVARFIGVDGPRWFVRGVIQGEAALHPEDAEEIEGVFADLVVVRGEEPVPPRELLPLRPPVNARPVRRRRPGGESADVTGERAPAEAPQLPERGPEITEVR